MPRLRCHAAAYGDRASEVTRIAEEQGLGRRLARGHPMLEAEVIYAVSVRLHACSVYSGTILIRNLLCCASAKEGDLGKADLPRGSTR